MQWRHLDTPGGQKSIGQRRIRQEVEDSRNMDSGRQDTSSEEDDTEDTEEVNDDEEDDDEEVGLITTTPLRVP